MDRNRHLSLIAACALALAALCAAGARAEDDKPAPAWVALWQDAYEGIGEIRFDPERMATAVAADRSTGEAYLSMWNLGIWKSTDGGKRFVRVDGGKISGNGCGPIQGNSFFVVPDGGLLATFNMNNGPGPSGCSYDGGKTWTSFEAVGRNWDFGAMDFQSRHVFAARHEDDGLHVSTDGGKTWTRLERERGGITGLAVLGTVLLLSDGRRIERSEDDGKTWAKIADFGATGPALVFKDRVYWLDESRRSVLVSGDQGKSWAVLGVPAPGKATLGPYFGKDENHVLVAGRDGILESTDGCKTWKLAVELPQDFASVLFSIAYDPVHDVFYAAARSRPVMKYARTAKPDYVTPVVPENDGEGPATPAKPRLADQAHPKVRCVVPSGADMNGDYLYLGGEDGILTVKRDRMNGKLAFVKQLPEERCGGYNICAAGGRLYGVTPHDGYRRMSWHGLAWFDLDPADGLPVKKGVVECPASRQMLAAPGGKDLYLKACRGKEDTIFWYRIGEDGKPAKAGEVTGKGIGPSRHADFPGILAMTPDARFLYAVSADDYAIACIERKPGGELVYRGATGLEAVAKRDPENAAYLWTSLGLSPDGKYLYASVRNGKPTDNVYAIFTRDAETGALAFVEKHIGEEDALANLKGWKMVFGAGGKTGYLGSFAGPLMSFQYDAEHGRLSQPVVIRETKYNGTSHLLLDTEVGLIYSGGREYGYDRVYVFQTGAAPAAKP